MHKDAYSDGMLSKLYGSMLQVKDVPHVDCYLMKNLTVLAFLTYSLWVKED